MVLLICWALPYLRDSPKGSFPGWDYLLSCQFLTSLLLDWRPMLILDRFLLLSPPGLSGTCTPRCFNLFMEWLVCSPVSFIGGNVDCLPVTNWKGVSLVSRLIQLLFASRISPDTAGEITFKTVRSCKIFWG